MDEGSLSDTQRTMVLPLLQETNIRGKPYITVSSKGIVNGLSRYPNDGADFGPDTTLGATAPGQYGNPYTETVGIQEGLNYSAIKNSGVADILLVGYNYNTTTTITINTNWTGVRIRGVLYSGLIGGNASTRQVYITQNSQTASSPLFALSSTSIGNLSYIIFKNIASILYNEPILDLTASEHTATIYVKNCTLYAQNGNVSISTGTATNGGAETVIIENSILKGQSNLYSFYGVPRMKNCSIEGTTSTTLNISGYTVVIEDCFFAIDLSVGCGTGGTITTLITKQLTMTSGTTLTNNNSQSGGWLFWNSIGDIISSEVINQYPTYIYAKGTQYTNISSLFSSSTVSTIFKHEGCLFFNTTIPPTTSGISTPSVPASGTEQENTNLFPVDVYVYGGTVTEIQITKGGTAYTVFSNSTGSALSGQAYKLNPGDSITITYTTAPTWEWLSD